MTEDEVWRGGGDSMVGEWGSTVGVIVVGWWREKRENALPVLEVVSVRPSGGGDCSGDCGGDGGWWWCSWSVLPSEGEGEGCGEEVMMWGAKEEVKRGRGEEEKEGGEEVRGEGRGDG